MSGAMWCIMVQLWCKKSTFILSFMTICVINIVSDMIYNIYSI